MSPELAAEQAALKTIKQYDGFDAYKSDGIDSVTVCTAR
jgi:hypothetical protein